MGRYPRHCAGFLAYGLSLALPCAAAADPAQVQVVPLSPLQFGSFAVPTRGSVELDPSGAVRRDGVVSIASGDTAPARFLVRYDRGNNGRNRLDLRFQLIVTPPASFSTPGLSASLSRLQTNLPGYASIVPGQSLELVIPRCVQRVCEQAFNVGGRLDVARQFGGGTITIPLQVTAVIVDVR